MENGGSIKRPSSRCSARVANLLAALDKVERGDEGVGSTASDGTTEGAGRVVLARVELDGARGGLRGTNSGACNSKRRKNDGDIISTTAFLRVKRQGG